jgi:hypothetical protein
MTSESVSEINVFLEISKNSKVHCQLKRHLSPKTIGLILRALPLSGNSHYMNKSIVYFQTKIDSGIERKKTNFKKGDIAYLPIGGSICFYLDDVLDGQPMTPLGKLSGDFRCLKQLKSDSVLKIYSETA